MSHHVRTFIVMADVHDFDEIKVQRLNAREADGRLRYALANRERLPGAII